MNRKLDLLCQLSILCKFNSFVRKFSYCSCQSFFYRFQWILSWFCNNPIVCLLVIRRQISFIHGALSFFCMCFVCIYPTSIRFSSLIWKSLLIRWSQNYHIPNYWLLIKFQRKYKMSFMFGKGSFTKEEEKRKKEVNIKGIKCTWLVFTLQNALFWLRCTVICVCG